MIDEILAHAPALIVAIPLLGAFLTPLISKINDKVRNIFVILTIGLTAVFVFLLAYKIMFNGVDVISYVFGAAQTLPLQDSSYTHLIRIVFEIDAMSIFMAIISVILAFVAIIYSWAFMKENSGLDKYYTLFLLMLAGMLGMELTGDMFNFFVFLEITSISSCALIAFWTHKGESIEAAFKYIVISAIGALFVLLAVAILYGQYNALNIGALSNLMNYTFLDKIALVLLIGALFMKAGIVPMHMWLPDAYGRAPASVTVGLVGATLASLYGVFRVIFTLYGKALPVPNQGTLGFLIVLLAIITILLGVFMALRQVDFKRLIAFAAVAEIGYMFLGVGAGMIAAGQIYGTAAMNGGIFHIMNDALDVGLLFLVAGAIYYATKETSLNQLGGLARNMKYTTIFFIIGLLAVSGIPPMNGFASKLLIYESTYQINPILAIVAILSSIMLLAVFVKVFYSVFLGPAMPKFQNVREVPKSMLLAMGIISCIIIFFGLFPDLIVNNIVQPAADALMNYEIYIEQVVGVI